MRVEDYMHVIDELAGAFVDDMVPVPSDADAEALTDELSERIADVIKNFIVEKKLG